MIFVKRFYLKNKKSIYFYRKNKNYIIYIFFNYLNIFACQKQKKFDIIVLTIFSQGGSL